MAMYLPQTLETLVLLGMNVVIEDGGYLPQTLIGLAQAAKRSGAHITISGPYLPQTLEEIARIGGNQVTLIVKKA